MKRLAPALEMVLESRTRRIPTALLNRLTADWTAATRRRCAKAAVPG